MTAAELIAEIEQIGGEVFDDSDGRGVVGFRRPVTKLKKLDAISGEVQIRLSYAN
jgi:hypothetical protein